MSYAVVVHVIARCRSCYAYKACGAPWLWLARVRAFLLYMFRRSDETEVAVMTQEAAAEWLSTYRNWMGENRRI